MRLRRGYGMLGVVIDERARLERFLAGQRASAQAQQELQRAEGPKPERAVAQALSALSALRKMGRFPAPRDAFSQAAIDEVRARWARIQNRAQKQQR